MPQIPSARGRRPGEAGFAVIVVISLIAILFLYIAVNARTLHQLTRELKFVEQKQVQRLATPPAHTNAPSATNRLDTPLSQQP